MLSKVKELQAGNIKTWIKGPDAQNTEELAQKIEYDKIFKSREEARMAIFEWVETFYNNRRIHSALGIKVFTEKVMVVFYKTVFTVSCIQIQQVRI